MLTYQIKLMIVSVKHVTRTAVLVRGVKPLATGTYIKMPPNANTRSKTDMPYITLYS